MSKNSSNANNSANAGISYVNLNNAVSNTYILTLKNNIYKLYEISI